MSSYRYLEDGRAMSLKIYWLAGFTLDQEGKPHHWTSDGKGGLIEESECPECGVCFDELPLDRCAAHRKHSEAQP